MTVEFKKLKPTRIFQNVVDQIQAAIIDGRLAPGDMLPSEMKLKEMFETSRGTIREALRVLEQKGLIDIKIGVGGGALVKDVNTDSITEGLNLLMQYQKVSLDHLAEFREGVEGSVAALAAERATRLDVNRLKKLLGQARKMLEDSDLDGDAFVRIDIRMHIALAEIAGNPVYIAALKMVHQNILGPGNRFALRKKAVFKENYRDLCAIVQAVERGEVDEARFLARDHVRRFRRHLQKNR